MAGETPRLINTKMCKLKDSLHLNEDGKSIVRNITSSLFSLCQSAVINWSAFTIFGGALRDLALKKNLVDINDFNVRIYFDDEQEEARFVAHLNTFYGERFEVRLTQCEPPKSRYFVRHPEGFNLHISTCTVFCRPHVEFDRDGNRFNLHLGFSDGLAMERVLVADLGISAIAYSSSGFLFWHESFEVDIASQGTTLTIQHDEKSERVVAYVKRMKEIFNTQTILTIPLHLQLGGQDYHSTQNKAHVTILMEDVDKAYASQ